MKSSYKRILKNKYFQTVLYSQGPNLKPLLIILRRDTLELWKVISCPPKNRYEIESFAKNLINEFEIPQDWKKPHRYCIAYYVRMVIKRDWFNNVVFDGQLTERETNRFINRLINHQYFLLKRLNSLSFNDKKQLLIFTDQEKEEGYNNPNNAYNFYAREYLYNRLFDKTGLEDLFNKFKLEKDSLWKKTGGEDD